MARDYKNAKRSGGKKSGSMNFFIGLGLGLVAAVGVHVFDKQAADKQLRAARVEPETHNKNEKPAPASQNAEPQEHLDFYEMLPKFEVVIPDKGKDARGKDAHKSAPATAIDKPGSYILQAGSYRTYGEADRVKALLALQGVQSRIEKAPIESETWHRVRVGPIRNLQELDETRRKIREAQIDALVIRVPD
jgi:cell division protein FtsN